MYGSAIVSIVYRRYLESLHLILVLGDFGVGHGVVAEAALFGLNADVGHRCLRCAFEIAVTIGGNSDYRAFGNVKCVIVNLKTSFAGQDDIILLILLMTVEERYGCATGECAE